MCGVKRGEHAPAQNRAGSSGQTRMARLLVAAADATRASRPSRGGVELVHVVLLSGACCLPVVLGVRQPPPTRRRPPTPQPYNSPSTTSAAPSCRGSCPLHASSGRQAASTRRRARPARRASRSSCRRSPRARAHQCVRGAGAARVRTPARAAPRAGRGQPDPARSKPGRRRRLAITDNRRRGLGGADAPPQVPPPIAAPSNAAIGARCVELAKLLIRRRSAVATSRPIRAWGPWGVQRHLVRRTRAGRRRVLAPFWRPS